AMAKADGSTEVETNQQGQQLGRKGLRTRQKIMEAARKLLEAYSPVELTAVAIAKEAGTSSASFYMYFQDVRDVLFALASEAASAMGGVFAVVEKPWEFDLLHAHALELVEVFNGIWDAHRQILRFRNLEADRGDPRFEELRTSTYIPFIDKLARRMLATYPESQQRPTLGQAFAMASVVHAAMERMASTDPAVIARGLGMRKVNEALAHLITLSFTAGPPGTQSAPAGKTTRTRRPAAD
ncbi:MAG: hypothetical protein RL260_2694, partial [Pseudomonadota bacterium]